MKIKIYAGELYWIFVAIIIALLLWLTPKIDASESELDKYLTAHNLRLPPFLEERLKQLNLVPAFGMECEENFHNHFTVYYVHKDKLPSEEDIKELNMIDPNLIILKVRYNTMKKSVIVEFVSYDRKIWESVEFGQKKVRLEFFGL